MNSNIYESLYLLDSGMFGKVYVTKHKYTNELFALKQDTTNDKLVLHESKILKTISNHPNIPKFKWYGLINNLQSMVIELLDISLINKVTINKELNFKLFNKYKFDILNVIHFIHSKGIIHRDIKPDNFMLKNERIYLIDFGLATRFNHSDGDITYHKPIKSGIQVIGSYKYCSKNMHKGFLPSRRDDIESMLYVFIYIINGNVPWNNICTANINEKNNQYMMSKERIIVHDEKCKNPYLLKVIKILKIVSQIEYSAKPQYNLFKQILSTD